ncbi:MAG: MmcQ/YjbR family DNA-binding protein [Lachnospiraceae bacterium]|nr:MmcQ/YjbR family DNA-binding protein [Lachnospiraceae bacterium]
MFEDVYFKRKKLNPSKLFAYGFETVSGGYRYVTAVLDGNFILTVMIDDSGKVQTEMIEQDTKEAYILYKVENAAGGFIGAVKSACEEVLLDIAEKCYDPDVFQSEQTKELIEYVRSRYGDELEFLWEKSPNNAVWRRKDTKKWYAAVLTVSKQKLGLQSSEIVEIIDLRLHPEQIKTLVDNQRYFPGWHMNKKNWYTMILDNTITTEEICSKIDESYRLAVK